MYYSPTFLSPSPIVTTFAVAESQVAHEEAVARPRVRLTSGPPRRRAVCLWAMRSFSLLVGELMEPHQVLELVLVLVMGLKPVLVLALALVLASTSASTSTSTSASTSTSVLMH